MCPSRWHYHHLQHAPGGLDSPVLTSVSLLWWAPGRNVELRGKLASVEQLTFGNSASATAFGLRQFQTQQPARPAAPAQEPVDLGREAREQSVAKPASASTAPSAGPSHPPPPAPASKTSPAAAQSNASGRVETSASQPAPMSGSNRVVTDLATTPGDVSHPSLLPPSRVRSMFKK